MNIHEYQAKVIDLYIPYLYGDITNKKEFIYQTIIKILKKNKYLKLTKGEQKRDFLHTKDFKKLFLKILKFNPKKNIQNLKLAIIKIILLRQLFYF